MHIVKIFMFTIFDKTMNKITLTHLVKQMNISNPYTNCNIYKSTYHYSKYAFDICSYIPYNIWQGHL